MSSGCTSFAMASLWSDCFSGFQGLEAIRDAHRTSGTMDSFEIDTAPEKHISYTLIQWRSADEQNSRDVSSEISVGLHFSRFGQAAPTLLSLDAIPDAMRGTVY